MGDEMKTINVTAASKSALNLKLISCTGALLVCTAAFAIGAYLSWEGTGIYLELDQGMTPLKASLLSAFLSLIIVGTGLSANTLGKVIGSLMLIISFATAGLSAYSINTGKESNVAETISDQRKVTDEYHQLQSNVSRQQKKVESYNDRAQKVDQQINTAFAGLEALNNATAKIAAEACTGKFATRCHNQKQETMRRMRKTKDSDQAALEQLKADKKDLKTEESGEVFKLKLAQAELKQYNEKTAEIISAQQLKKQNTHLIWSVLPDLSTALMSFLIGKILIAMSLILQQKQVLQMRDTAIQQPVTTETETVTDCFGAVTTTENTPQQTAIPEKLLARVIACQSTKNLTPDQAEWEYRQCIQQGTAPLKTRTIKKNFPALQQRTIPMILEDMFEQGHLNRTVKHKTNGDHHQTHYSYPLPEEEGGKETNIHPKASADEWQSANYHKRAQLSLVQ